MAAVGRESRFMPTVKCSTCDRAYTAQSQLTPVSQESGSQSTVSPQTPNAQPSTGKPDDFFSPQIANSSPPPPQSARLGGYGGLNENSEYEGPALQTSTSKQDSNMMSRLDIMTNLSDSGRRPSAPAPTTSSSSLSSGLGSGRMPKPQSGYGGFGPPSRAPDGTLEPPRTPNRSETFPRPSDRFGPPTRTPSAPTPSAALHPDRLQPPLGSPGAPLDGRDPMASERPRRPSRGPDTSRPPPPRTNMVRPTTPGVPTINLAEEFGIGNPYHTPSESTSSTESSENSSQPERRPSQASQASSRTSPPRSLASRAGTSPTDTSNLDSLMTDIQSSMNEMKPKPPVPAPLKLPPRGFMVGDRPSPLSARPPRSAERGYDPRIDPAVQNPRLAKGKSPAPSPMPNTPLQDGLTVHIPNDVLSPSTAGLPSPRWINSPERIEPMGDRRPSQAHARPQTPAQPQAASQRQPPPEPQPERPSEPSRSRSRSRPREPAPTSSRGNCKACGQAITGKSISSADGRLTGRYHKPCFVCTTCRRPFSSSTFYVLDDRPYCELHYHELNGSLCGSCGRGIEGQYLEDESAVKHHVGCFKCGVCRMALRDGYFEVNGKAYCEQDAWRLAGGGMNGGPPPPAGPGGRGFRPPHMGLPGGPRPGMGAGYNPSRLGPMGQRPRMEKRMTRLGMM
ncbi:hypothetical protein C7999DRAFT_13282 [Corynascus novoguineensis]|uniref:LIM zinc-binding domain-containing protein n=1 Tax=Corynascus novoguineensis TaxID=1126955 RepID=A0AAN7CWY8_9PEZI|nr:hypothetical protein C7999DRAFT_13282 [Corynascus novoguineensis]